MVLKPSLPQPPHSLERPEKDLCQLRQQRSCQLLTDFRSVQDLESNVHAAKRKDDPCGGFEAAVIGQAQQLCAGGRLAAAAAHLGFSKWHHCRLGHLRLSNTTSAGATLSQAQLSGP